MDAPELVRLAFDRNAWRVEEALEGLSDEDLRFQPNDHSNPIGWLLWHPTRTADLIAESLSGETQVWLAGGWKERFGLPFGDRDTGVGHTMEQVRSLNASKADLLGYLKAVQERLGACLGRLAPADLDREVPHYRREESVRAADLLVILLTDFHQHAGQICYLRGFLSGPGWRE